VTPRQAAIAAGEKRYHGKPCRKCANTERYTMGRHCVVCDGKTSRDWQRYRYESDPEWRDRKLERNADVTAVEYARRLLMNRRRQALKRMAARNRSRSGWGEEVG
jgi:hypothetical protein